MSEQHDPDRKAPSIAVRAAVLVVVIAALSAAIYLKRDGSADRSPTETDVSGPATLTASREAALPRLVEFGRGQCVACKMMKPVLEEIEREFRDSLIVESVDVDEAPEMAQQFYVRLIPLQVFLDPEGNELFRHEGFFSKEEILAKWRELGFDLTPSDSDGA